ncbi:uncharacterized protein LOC113305779 [Papaver somniferum]|uniref:uncharacterized protein LOC113305779 n=1 Tax=Papaver somniferum TaxID=3469 RepID=UPI000E6F9907|nr:uncharacterized protein LOC113305779 [Papaver somniferum]
MIDEFKEAMIREFEMKDMGLMTYFLGLEVLQSDKGIFVSQKRYAKTLLERFKVSNCKAIRTPVEKRLKLEKGGNGECVNPTYLKQLVGSLRYLTSTRPDIVYGVGLVSRFMETPFQPHLQAARRILRYVKGTINLGMFYSTSRKA